MTDIDKRLADATTAARARMHDLHVLHGRLWGDGDFQAALTCYGDLRALQGQREQMQATRWPEVRRVAALYGAWQRAEAWVSALDEVTDDLRPWQEMAQAARKAYEEE